LERPPNLTSIPPNPATVSDNLKFDI